MVIFPSAHCRSLRSFDGFVVDATSSLVLYLYPWDLSSGLIEGSIVLFTHTRVVWLQSFVQITRSFSDKADNACTRSRFIAFVILFKRL